MQSSISTRANGSPVTTRGRRPASLRLKLTLLISTLAVTLFLFEVGTRVFTDIQPPLIYNHDILGATFLPKYEGRVFIPESDQYVNLRFNRDGMRGAGYSHDKPDDVRRVAIVGDSMVAAVGTPEDQTAVNILQRRLSQTPGYERWEVMNFGVSGSATGQELVLYREVIRNYDPDIVVCAFCIWNDFGDNSRRLSSNPHRIYFDLDEVGQLYQLKHSQQNSRISAWLNAHSRFYLWQKHATRVVASRTKQTAGMLPKAKLIYNCEPSEELERSWLITEKLIETFHDEVEQDGGQFVLALLPSADQVHDENWQRVLEDGGSLASQMDADYPSERLSAECDRIGVSTIDMVEAFRDAAPHRSRKYEGEWLHYLGRGHFNPAGNELVADQIYEFLVTQ